MEENGFITIRDVRIHITPEQIRVRSREEQFRLARIALAGNEEENLRAREELVLSMTALIIKKALLYEAFRGELLNDAIQECRIALLRIFSPPDVESGDTTRFDPDMGVKPVTYAATWIISILARVFDKLVRPVSVPNYLTHKLRKLYRHESAAGQELTEMREELGLDEEKISNARKTMYPTSLDVKLMEESSSSPTLLDAIAGEEEIFNPEVSGIKLIQREILEEAMKTELTQREQIIIRGRFGLDGEEQILKELGDQLGISRERVRQLEKRAIDKLKAWAIRTNIRNHFALKDLTQ